MNQLVKEQIVQLENLCLAVKIWGTSDKGIPILAVHGWLDNANSFAELAEQLNGFQIIAVDLPGHGLSEHRSTGVYHFIDYVADMIELVDTLDLQKVMLMGHSLGAGIAALVAGTIPDRVERLILIEGFGPLTNLDQNAPQMLKQALEDANQNVRHPPRTYPDFATPLMLRAKISNLDPEVIRSLVSRGLKQIEDGWQWRADPRLRLASRLRLTEAQVHAFLTNIQCPVLCIKAEQGLMHNAPQALKARMECIHDLCVKEFAGGHHLHKENPVLVAQAINQFLSIQKA